MTENGEESMLDLVDANTLLDNEKFDASIFQSENWSAASFDQRKDALQNYEYWAASQQGRPPREITTDGDFCSDIEGAEKGGYLDFEDGKIHINPNLILGQETSNGVIEAPPVKKALFVTGHEGIHALQDDYQNGELVDEKKVIELSEVDSRFLDVETMEDCFSLSKEEYLGNYTQQDTEQTANIGSLHMGEKFLSEEVYPHEPEEGQKAVSEFRDYASQFPGVEQTQKNELGNSTDTMRSLADETGLPPTSQTNALDNELARTKDNSMGIE